MANGVLASATLEERVVRIEGLLGLRPNLRIAGGSEFWVIQARGNRGDRSLDYWGPYPTQEAAALAPMFIAEYGCVIAEVPV